MSQELEKKPYATSFRFKSVTLYKVGKDYANPEVTLHDGQNGMLVSFQYNEDIMWPSYGATMVLVDNAQNVISDMPIQGYERVVVEVDDLTGEGRNNNGGIYTYEFRIHSVFNRVANNGAQVYTLGLISIEGLKNEAIRVNKKLEGNTSTVVSKILDEYLKVRSDKIKVEPSATSIKLLPTKKSPYSVIRSLCPRTISEKTGVSIGKKNSTSVEDNNSESDVNPQTSEKATGTAGYLFFQTNEAYHFKSIDNLVDGGEKFDGDPVRNLGENNEFVYSPAIIGRESLNRIQEVLFESQIDMFKRLRQGAYSNICCYFNINTGEYEERLYKVSDNWDDMAHLGSQTGIGVGQRDLSKYPSRVMSTVINHENFYNDPDIASNEDKHGGDGKNSFPDFQKHYLSQGIARAGILFNQQLTISLTGHLELCAGDKIEIKIPDQKSEDEKKPWDPEYSGTYLIKNLNHQFMTGSTPKVYTVLELVRDSQGIKYRPIEPPKTEE